MKFVIVILFCALGFGQPPPSALKWTVVAASSDSKMVCSLDQHGKMIVYDYDECWKQLDKSGVEADSHNDEASIHMLLRFRQALVRWAGENDKAIPGGNAK